MENATNKTIDKNNNFFKRLKEKLFFSEMSISKILAQTTLAGLLIAVAAILELFVMVNAGPFELCFGFFVVLLFPLLLDFRISIIAAIISVTITELAISGGTYFWIQYAGIIISFPIIKAFTLFDKKWLFALGLLIGATVYIMINTLEMKLVMGTGFGITYMISQIIQMVVAVPIALLLYFPIKKVMPKSSDNSWEKDQCCDECEPSINKDHQCCDDNCEDECKNK